MAGHSALIADRLAEAQPRGGLTAWRGSKTLDQKACAMSRTGILSAERMRGPEQSPRLFVAVCRQRAKEVAFHDGRPFHRFAAGESGAGTDHLCGADLYRVAYDWSAWPDWRAVWEVTGPRKDYRMESRYRRD